MLVGFGGKVISCFAYQNVLSTLEFGERSSMEPGKVCGVQKNNSVDKCACSGEAFV